MRLDPSYYPYLGYIATLVICGTLWDLGKPWSYLGSVVLGIACIALDLLNPSRAVYGGWACFGTVLVITGLFEFFPGLMNWYKDWKWRRKNRNTVLIPYDRFGKRM